MKIIQVNCVYGKGSTGKIVLDLHSKLQKNGYESVVLYGRGNTIRRENVYKICGELYAKGNKLVSMITGIMYGGCIISTNRLISMIKKEKPDIVHLHCINGNFVNIYRLIKFLKNQQLKTVLTLHAEFMYTGGCAHSIFCNRWKSSNGCRHCPRWRLETNSLFFDRTHTMWKQMYNAFEDFGNHLTVVSVSPWLKKRAESSPILGDFKHCVILNGLNCKIFKPTNPDIIRQKHCLSNEKIIFHATPKFDNSLNNIKGGYYVLKLAEELKDKNIKFLIAGNYTENLKVPENVILLGEITSQEEMASYYSAANVTILTSKRETFSMIVAESLCCGTPVVGFTAGAPEQIAIEEYSDFSEFGNIVMLKKNVLRWINIKVDSKKLHELAAEKYSRERMVQNYIKLYKEYDNG